MRTKAQELRRTWHSKRAEEQHCYSSKCSHFNEENGEEVSLCPTLAQCFSMHDSLHSSKIPKVVCRGAVPGGGPSRGPLWHCPPCAHTAEGPSVGKGLARTCSVLLERDHCSRGMG